MKIEKDVIRAAMVGCGNMANLVHYPSIAKMEDVELVAICDINEQALNKTGDMYGIEKRYTDYRKMVEEVNPDVMYVVGPPHLMYDIWVWCLSRGINLFIEKPMGVTIHQARSLKVLAEKNNCITQVGFQRRNSPMYQTLMEECKKHGPVVNAVCTFNKENDGPMFTAYDEMLDITVHAIDTLRWICGGEVVDIKSSVKRIDSHHINVIIAMLEFDNGATGIVMNNHTSGRRIFSIEVHCRDISVVAELEGKGYLYEKGRGQSNAYGSKPGVEFSATKEAGSDENYIFGGYYAKHREFIDCVKSGRQPSSCFADAFKTMEVADKILAQASFKNV